MIHKLKGFLGADEQQPTANELDASYNIRNLPSQHGPPSQYNNVATQNRQLDHSYGTFSQDQQRLNDPSMTYDPSMARNIPPQQSSQQFLPQSAYPTHLYPDSVNFQMGSVVPPQPVDELAGISVDPQVITHEDCVVMVLKPREFFRKKLELTRAGPHNLQVFSDFEHVVTKFKNNDGGKLIIFILLKIPISVM